MSSNNETTKTNDDKKNDSKNNVKNKKMRLLKQGAGIIITLLNVLILFMNSFFIYKEQSFTEQINYMSFNCFFFWSATFFLQSAELIDFGYPNNLSFIFCLFAGHKMAIASITCFRSSDGLDRHYFGPFCLAYAICSFILSWWTFDDEKEKKKYPSVYKKFVERQKNSSNNETNKGTNKYKNETEKGKNRMRLLKQGAGIIITILNAWIIFSSLLYNEKDLRSRVPVVALYIFLAQRYLQDAKLKHFGYPKSFTSCFSAFVSVQMLTVAIKNFFSPDASARYYYGPFYFAYATCSFILSWWTYDGENKKFFVTEPTTPKPPTSNEQTIQENIITV